jgi:hypothetical protein
MSYAHWEGFVKEAAIAYIGLVSYDPPPLERLTANFQAIACRQELLNASSASKRIGPHIELVRHLVDDCGSSAHMSPDRAIDTESNLNAEVLQNVCASIGIAYEPYWSERGPFVNDLVMTRCAIAHGELIELEDDYAREVLMFALTAIDAFKNDVENAALAKTYLRPIDLA